MNVSENHQPAASQFKTDASELDELIRELSEVRASMLDLEAQSMVHVGKLHPTYQESARNLLHYLALRRHDVRSLQRRLAALGLSSLGRAEACVLSSVEAALHHLNCMVNRTSSFPPARAGTNGFDDGRALLELHTEALLGAAPSNRQVRIMVTMPSEAADDNALVHDLLESGMNCMRVNCAHDDAATWERMIQNLRRAEAALGRKCRVLMDLAGPKLRTGPIEPAEGVVKWRPRRDAFGAVQAPARVWLTRADQPATPPTPADACLSVPAEWLAHLKPGHKVRFRDARGAKRRLKIVDMTAAGCWAECRQTAYVTAGIILRHRGRGSSELAGKGTVGTLPPRAQAILLQPGDTLILTREPAPGRPAVYDSQGRLLTPARISCTLPEIFADIRPGERIWLDDGKIGGVIRAVGSDEIHVKITQSRSGGDKLRADKGINLPDSTLRVPSLTAKDLADLAFVTVHADLVGFSFVREAADVADLEERLAALDGPRPGIVLKIETRQAFENLPNLLLASMTTPCDGVMIARGDLAVECGYERLAEVQEQILWICEAAHVPVIWATQVLENLAREGLPSRAEITDAALGQRAECVMLNKGPHIITAVRVLDDILCRMEPHQSKKRSMLRPLQLARAFAVDS
jgi:pyruvate kinase